MAVAAVGIDEATAPTAKADFADAAKKTSKTALVDAVVASASVHPPPPPSPVVLPLNSLSMPPSQAPRRP